MDFRNLSAHQLEATANNERTRILNLFQRYPQRVHALPDLSMRKSNDDEWDLLDYPSMSIQDRSHASLRRRAVSLLHSISCYRDEAEEVQNEAGTRVRTSQQNHRILVVCSDDAVPESD